MKRLLLLIASLPFLFASCVDEDETLGMDLIDEEDKRKPLSDDKLSQLLNEAGHKVARRTVAKYREKMNIPSATLRKEFF